MEPAERVRARINPTTVVAGLLYLVLGVLFLAERAGWLRFGPELVVPVLLIGLGAAVLAGARRAAPQAAAPPAPPVADKPEPPAQPLDGQPE